MKVKAFPSGTYKAGSGENVALHHGMDLRDYFAGLAMQAIIIGLSSNDDGQFFWSHALNDVGNSDRSLITENAYEIADAMMKER